MGGQVEGGMKGQRGVNTHRRQGGTGWQRSRRRQDGREKDLKALVVVGKGAKPGVLSVCFGLQNAQLRAQICDLGRCCESGSNECGEKTRTGDRGREIGTREEQRRREEDGRRSALVERGGQGRRVKGKKFEGCWDWDGGWGLYKGLQFGLFPVLDIQLIAQERLNAFQLLVVLASALCRLSPLLYFLRTTAILGFQSVRERTCISNKGINVLATFKRLSTH
eukprot:3491044-Rhodomonas_salina.1